MNQTTDYLVIGASVAGLAAAHLLSELGQVTVITKGRLKEEGPYLARGGFAAVTEQDDHFEKHIQDTLAAGYGHSDPSVVRHVVENAPRAFRFLKSVGVKFAPEPMIESGHSQARTWHTDDFTAHSIFIQLLAGLRKNKNVHFIEEAEVVKLAVQSGECWGAFVKGGGSDELRPVLAKHTLLATGGIGQLFRQSAHAFSSAADGLALALEAGLALKDMEFVHFHPLAYATMQEGVHFAFPEPLLDRGAMIVSSEGERFLRHFDARGELAPRDLLARAIYFEQMNGPVFMDARHLDQVQIKNYFPQTLKILKGWGIDLAKTTLPITPAAHSACGGVPVDLKGTTALPGLFALGEAACSGLHGANPLPSNWLTESIVFAMSVTTTLQRSVALDSQKKPEQLSIEIPSVVFEDEAHVKAYAQRIRQIMWEHVGLVRTVEGLEQARQEIEAIPARDFRIQLRQKLCQAIITACLNRPQSLGSHYVAESIL